MKKTMQKSRKRLGALALATAMMLGALPLIAAAPNQVTAVTGEMRPQVSVMVDGVERDFYNAQGQQVYAVFYDGTHYLPVRAIGELMGKNVNWDQSTLTISLTAPRTTGTVQGTPGTAAQAQSIQMENRPDFTILVEGEKKSFKDAQGNAVYPMLYQGTTYLPVRAIGELMGKNVSWNSQSAVITLGSSSGSLVTDADSFEQGGNQGNQQNPTTGITLEQAKQKALAHAGLNPNQVTFVKGKLEWDDGRQVYDVEFYTTNYKEYDYEIDAATGAILSYDFDAENYIPQQNTGSYIGAEKAKSVALAHAGVNQSQVTRLRCELEKDDGRWEYQVEFCYGTMEYEYEIDAYTGAILSRDMESIYD